MRRAFGVLLVTLSLMAGGASLAAPAMAHHGSGSHAEAVPPDPGDHDPSNSENAPGHDGDGLGNSENAPGHDDDDDDSSDDSENAPGHEGDGPGNSENAPGHDDDDDDSSDDSENAPGHEGDGPGNSENAPGHEGDGPGNSENAPGHEGDGPGNSENAPGHEGDGPGNSENAPGHEGDGPGNSENAPGHEGDGPGNSENAPGHEGDRPGNSENAPGHEGDGPGNSENAPGHEGDGPGNSENAPGHEGDGPGNSENAPGHEGDGPGNSENAPGHEGDGPGDSGENRATDEDRSQSGTNKVLPIGASDDDDGTPSPRLVTVRPPVAAVTAQVQQEVARAEAAIQSALPVTTIARVALQHVEVSIHLDAELRSTLLSRTIVRWLPTASASDSIVGTSPERLVPLVQIGLSRALESSTLPLAGLGLASGGWLAVGLEPSRRLRFLSELVRSVS